MLLLMSLSAHGIQFLFTPLNRHSLSTLHTPHLFAGTWDKKTNEAQSFAPVSAFPVFNLASMSLHVGSAFDSRSRAHLWYNMRKVQKNNEERMITLQCTHRYLLIYHSITSFLPYQQIFKEMIFFFLTRKTVFYCVFIVILCSICKGTFVSIITHVSLSLLSEVPGNIPRQTQCFLPTFPVSWDRLFSMTPANLICHTSHIFLNFVPIEYLLPSLPFCICVRFEGSINVPWGEGRCGCEGHRWGWGRR